MAISAPPRPKPPPTRLRPRLERGEWTRLIAMAGVVLGLFVIGMVLLAAASAHHFRIAKGEVFGLGTGMLALTLGMRHAFDADHISAIDNTTRKFMAEGRRPLSVGFFFALGHSSVVFVLAVLLNFGIRALDSQVSNSHSGLHAMTSIIGTSVSALFLYAIAALNLGVLVGLLRIFAGMRQGRFRHDELDEQLDRRGLMNRVLGPLARRVDAPWKMYPVGVLFGLGFDTASEVALLVLSGSAVTSGLPFYAILSLPILFAAGMTLFDLADGCFMNFAYGWAFFRPIRKIYYNVAITALSVAVAVVIGTIELLGLLPGEIGWHGGAWRFFANFNLNRAGFFVIGLFALTWVVAMAVWRLFHIEDRFERRLAEVSEARSA